MELPFFPGKITSKSHVDFGRSSCVHLGDKKKRQKKKITKLHIFQEQNLWAYKKSRIFLQVFIFQVKILGIRSENWLGQNTFFLLPQSVPNRIVLHYLLLKYRKIAR